MKLKPIAKIGSYRKGKLSVSFDEIVEKLFLPNATHLDDPIKVKASWGFEDENGRQGFIWCYQYDDAEFCYEWSVDGDKSLFKELFGDEVEFEK